MNNKLIKVAEYLAGKGLYEEAAQIKKIAQELKGMSFAGFLKEIDYDGNKNYHQGDSIVAAAIEDSFSGASGGWWGLCLYDGKTPALWVASPDNPVLKLYGAQNAVLGARSHLGDMTYEDFLKEKLHKTAGEAYVMLSNHLHERGARMNAGFSGDAGFVGSKERATHRNSIRSNR
jgi:hypothetical protein